jgi:DNA-binding transcriptional ArsR family regulator
MLSMPNGLSALGDPTRQRIVEMLAEGELSAGEISQHFEMSAPAISQHLKVLKEAGLVKVRIEGQRRVYELEPDGLTELAAWLNRIRLFWSARLNALEERLTSNADKKEK